MNETTSPQGASANMKAALLAVVLIPLAAVIIFVMVSNNDTGTDGDVVTTPSGLKYIDIKVGTGPEARAGDSVTVHYTGKLKNGTKFDSSLDRNQPFTFTLGAREVIKGWDEGVAGMKVGGARKLIIPSKLAYGPGGRGQIPPDAELTFDVALLDVK